MLQLNFVSVFALCKFSLPHLRATRGNVINVSSLVGAIGQAKATTYAATKGAVTSFTKARGRARARAPFVSPSPSLCPRPGVFAP